MFQALCGCQDHEFATRMAHLENFRRIVTIRTETHGKKLLKFNGPKILNNIKGKLYYSTSRSKGTFMRHHKQTLLDKY